MGFSARKESTFWAMTMAYGLRSNQSRERLPAMAAKSPEPPAITDEICRSLQTDPSDRAYLRPRLRLAETSIPFS